MLMKPLSSLEKLFHCHGYMYFILPPTQWWLLHIFINVFYRVFLQEILSIEIPIFRSVELYLSHIFVLFQKALTHEKREVKILWTSCGKSVKLFYKSADLKSRLFRFCYLSKKQIPLNWKLKMKWVTCWCVWFTLLITLHRHVFSQLRKYACKI
jgi:hypothetical protein